MEVNGNKFKKYQMEGIYKCNLEHKKQSRTIFI